MSSKKALFIVVMLCYLLYRCYW